MNSGGSNNVSLKYEGMHHLVVEKFGTIKLNSFIKLYKVVFNNPLSKNVP